MPVKEPHPLRCDKQKDAEPLKDMSMKLRKLRMAGRSSCVIARATKEPATSTATEAPYLGSDRKAREALVRFGPTGAKFSEWEGASDLASSTFKDAKKRLENRGFVERAEDGKWFATRRTEAGPWPTCPTIAPPL